MSHVDINAIAKQFVDFYYATFASDRTNLHPLYRPDSMLTFEGTQIQGAEAIIEKLKSLPFEKVEHKVTTLDAQPSSTTVASLLVSVTGMLVVDGSENPLNFSQVFQLQPQGDSYYVFNDIFRLNYA
ncbi:nuclear transport factor 2 [Phlegmacium glaucopus]|nr:nuclear transport factor 2 [Phlegmacium glaucopus]